MMTQGSHLLSPSTCTQSKPLNSPAGSGDKPRSLVIYHFHPDDADESLVRRRICSTLRLVLALIFVVFLSRAFAQIPSNSTDRALKEAQLAFEQGDFAAAARSFEQ